MCFLKEQFWKYIFEREHFSYILKLAAELDEWYFLNNYKIFTALNCYFTNFFTASKNIHDFDIYRDRYRSIDQTGCE